MKGRGGRGGGEGSGESIVKDLHVIWGKKVISFDPPQNYFHTYKILNCLFILNNN